MPRPGAPGVGTGAVLSATPWRSPLPLRPRCPRPVSAWPNGPLVGVIPFPLPCMSPSNEFVPTDLPSAQRSNGDDGFWAISKSVGANSLPLHLFLLQKVTEGPWGDTEHERGPLGSVFPGPQCVILKCHRCQIPGLSLSKRGHGAHKATEPLKRGGSESQLKCKGRHPESEALEKAKHFLGTLPAHALGEREHLG
ncbi:hypothetical protein H1C71_007191 [Ictidomys tridecemlineatus]|nr:hypothetical protein H1C71_007191 [Ictidomys tridecemlineatus]